MLRLIYELFCFVLESGHLGRQKVISDEIIEPVSGAERLPYCPGCGVWTKVATMCLSLSVFPLTVLLRYLFPLFFGDCWIGVFKLCCRDGTQTEHRQISSELHAPSTRYLRGRLLPAASTLAIHPSLSPFPSCPLRACFLLALSLPLSLTHWSLMFKSHMCSGHFSMPSYLQSFSLTLLLKDVFPPTSQLTPVTDHGAQAVATPCHWVGVMQVPLACNPAPLLAASCPAAAGLHPDLLIAEPSLHTACSGLSIWPLG